ncbi:leptin-B [Oryzias melastigma]|uniref:Leptin-B n=1 Tax=Oryzias melastigma TaxID=30732 RepID=A0A3B3BJE0_ORYME|nr:leptin-B [Oryzias melastigma]
MLLMLVYASFLALPACTSPATKGNVIQIQVHNIVNLAQTTITHIRKLRTQLLMAPPIEITTPPIKGLASVSHYLKHLDNELQSPVTDLLSQIQADVSSLDGKVQSLGSLMNCPSQPRPTAEVTRFLFPDSHYYRTIAKVEHYLENLHLNREKLKVC